MLKKTRAKPRKHGRAASDQPRAQHSRKLQEIFLRLKEGISRSELKEKLSETQLMNQYRLSRNSSRYILNLLENDGWLRRVRGKGSLPVARQDGLLYSINILHTDEAFNQLIRTAANTFTLYSLMQGIFSYEHIDRCLVKYLFVRRSENKSLMHDKLRSLGKRDGIVILDPVNYPDLIDLCREDRIPYVTVGASGEESYNFIRHDSYQGARRAVEHLIKQSGRKRILMVGQNAASPSIELRRRGWENALGASGLKAEPALVVPYEIAPSGNRLDTDYLEKILTMDKVIDGIFISSHLYAPPVMELLKRLNRRVPEDVALIVFDDLPEYGEAVPGISAVKSPHRKIGQTLMAKVVEMIEFEYRDDIRITLGNELVLRGTT